MEVQCEGLRDESISLHVISDNVRSLGTEFGSGNWTMSKQDHPRSYLQPLMYNNVFQYFMFNEQHNSSYDPCSIFHFGSEILRFLRSTQCIHFNRLIRCQFRSVNSAPETSPVVLSLLWFFTLRFTLWFF